MENLDTLTREQDGEVYAKLCLDLTIYWRGSAFDRVDGILHFYERAMKEIGSALKFYETGTMSGAKPLRKDALEMLPTWLGKKRRRDIYMLNLESGAHRAEPSDRNFYFAADEEDDEPLGVMRLALPIDRAKKPDDYVKLVEDLVRDLNFESGHAGYALNWDSRGDMAGEALMHMMAVAGRYYGVDLFELDVTLVSMRQTKPAGIKCVNWLTLLGTELAALAGGVDALTTKLPKPCRVVPLPTGILIRAGDRPTLGDRQENADLSAYAAVGRVLAPFRFVNHQPLFGDEDTTNRWLSRFDA
jgi:hypothetical protein